MLVVQMFDYAWRPFYFAMEKEPDAKSIFARVLTYFVLVMSALFVVISLFINDIVKIRIFGHDFIHPDYWSGLNIVPIVLLGYMFLGVSNIFSAGIYIQKKTHLMPVVTFIGAGVNIVVNYWLIPIMGITGAALATLFAYFAMAVALYVMSKSVYPIQYEMGRMLKLVLVTGGIMVVYYYVPAPMPPVIFKLLLTAAFIVLVIVLKFFNEREINFIRKSLKRKLNVPPPVGGDENSSNGNRGV